MLGAAACGQDAVPTGTRLKPEFADACTGGGLDLTSSNVAKDGIPALTDPLFVSLDAPGATYLKDEDRVIGLVISGEALAVPLPIMKWHEIMNLDRVGARLAVTYCPLTGTSIVFDRGPRDGVAFGVTGLLLDNNLVMYDRSESESLWTQMTGGAICGPAAGTSLPRAPVVETTLLAWRTLHPDTKVTSSETGYDRNYLVNPYEDYERLDAPPLYDVKNRDNRRLPKERVVGIPEGDGGLAVPFMVLDATPRAALTLKVGPRTVVVFWDRASQSAAVYRPVPVWADGYERPVEGALTFEAAGDGYVDRETGTVWSIEGVAVAGPARGSRLPFVEDALVAYWFAWADFHPGTEVLSGL